MNSDPKMVAVFMKYLGAKDIDETRIRIRMMIHRQDDELKCRNYWKNVTSLNDSNFMSTVVKESGVVRHPLPRGTVTIRYNSVQLLREIKSDIRELVERIS